jgi:hypothetical protein
MTFYDRPDCSNPSPHVDEYGTKSGIFIIKGAVPQELIEKIESGLKALPEQPPLYKEGLISWYEEKMSDGVDGTHELWEIISEILSPEWVIHPSNNYLTIKPGNNGMFIHSDSPGKDQCHLLSQTDVWSTCCIIDYGVCTYFGDYEGGAIFYPHINPDGTIKGESDYDKDGECFEYTPEKGDIVIHSAFKPYEHGVREVTSGIRYCFSNFSLKAIDNPGTFYNYGTKEYIDQIGTKTPEEIKNWMVVLKENPQFTKEKVKIYQESGLKGEDLAEAFFQDMKHN